MSLQVLDLETAFVCGLCGKSFSTLTQRDRHQWAELHPDKLGSVRTECEYCKREFPSKGQCRRHQVECPKKREIQAEKQARKRVMLAAEEFKKKIHKEENTHPSKPKLCEFCKEVFRVSAREFDVHQRVCKFSVPVREFSGRVSILQEGNGAGPKIIKIDDYDLNDPGLAQYFA